MKLKRSLKMECWIALGQKAFSLMNSSMVVKIATVATVTVGGMAALSHLTHKDMGNATMMSGTS